ncbi:MAG: alanine racemase [Armatimonadetes bacterium]|nr:alanine racemase [Armatimonadota bacterium]
MKLATIELSKSALLHNIAAFRALAPGVPCMAVVKANAYGHGLAEVARAIEGAVDAFQVDDLDELAALREVTDKRALVLGYVERDEISEAVRLGGELAIYDAERLPYLKKAFESTKVRPVVHVKVDALLGRQGILPNQAAAFAAELAKYPEIEVASVYAHFANIEDTTDLTHAQAQLEMLAEARKAFAGVAGHSASSAAIMTVGAGPGSNLTRLGIGLYGCYPSAALARSHAEMALKPVLRWKTKLAQVKTLPAGHPVGYGLTYVTSKETRIGIVPQGYSDGYPRALSNTGEVLVGGVRRAVLGRVAMNMFAIDLSAAPEAKAEDVVVLIGRQGDEQITMEELAAKTGTINYEMMARISPLLPREVLD